MVKKDATKSITFRDNSQIIKLFEEIVDSEQKTNTAVYRSIIRDYLKQRGIDADTKQVLLDSLEERIESKKREIRQKERELKELEEQKDEIEELSEDVDLEENSQKQQEESKTSFAKEIRFESSSEEGDYDE